MKRLTVLAFLVVGLVVASSQAQPQRGGRGGGGGQGMMANPVMLLSQPSVQKELNISAEQKQQLQEAAAKLRQAPPPDFSNLSPSDRAEKMQEMAREGERTAAKILHRDQMKRLKEISLQVRGAGAFNDPEIAKALDLTDEQKEKIKTTLSESRGQRPQVAPGTDPQATRKHFEEMRKANLDKVMNVLTADQKTKWKEMTGEPFKGEITPIGGIRARRNQ
jgi:Spy/CpxP family protein refolding chaperone